MAIKEKWKLRNLEGGGGESVLSALSPGPYH